MCVFFGVCLVLVSLLINFLALFTSLSIRNFDVLLLLCVLSFGICLLLFRSSALIGPFHLLTLHLLHYFHISSNSVDVCVYVNVFLIWCRFFSLSISLSRSSFIRCPVSVFFHFFIRFRLLCVEIVCLCSLWNRLYIAKWNGWCTLSCRITMKRTYRNVCICSMNSSPDRRVCMWNEYSVATWLDFKINPFYTALYQIQ